MTGGTLSNFAASTVYTATFTASADGATSINVSAGAFSDATGNTNTAANQFTWSRDATAPSMTITGLTTKMVIHLTFPLLC